MKWSIPVRLILLVAMLSNLIFLGWHTPLSTAAAAGLTAPVAQDTTVYVVQRGDTLSAIARRFGTTVTALIQLNSLTNANQITVGQRLLIPSTGSTGPTRITFAAGQSSASQRGAFAAGGGSKQYLLNASAGQVLDLSVAGDPAPVSFIIKSPGGTQWPSEVWGIGGLTALKTIVLPQNGDYLISLLVPNAAPATNFNLNVTVLTPTPNSAPAERINFAAGATTADRRGALTSGGVKRYVLQAVAGQTMQVNTVARSVPVGFTLQSPRGKVYTGEALGSEVYIFAKTVALPESGDYLLTLNTPAGSAPTLYDVNFQITGPGGAPTPTPAPDTPPQRVTFAPGATSVTLSGRVTFPQRICYVLGAQAGQEMTVQIASPGDQANFLVSAVNIELIGGFPLKRLESEARAWTGPLPATTDYLVCVATPGGTVNYTLTISIPPRVSAPPVIRIQFPRGGTATTVTGQASSLRQQCYVLGASANQLMTVNVNSVGNLAGFSLVGADGSPLKRIEVGGPSFSARLPLTQDYTICVGAPAGTSTVDFTLFVSIIN